MKTGNAEEVEHDRLDELLGGYLTKVPPRVCSGSYNLSVDFKAAVTRCKKVRAKRGVKNYELQIAINDMHRFWGDA